MYGCCSDSMCFCFFLNFFFVELISSLIYCGLVKMLTMSSVFLKLLRLVLWFSMWSILENVSYALEKNDVYSAVLVGMFCRYLLASIWHLRPLFPYWFSVWNDISRGTIIVLLSISPFLSICICFIYLGAPMLGTYVFTNILLSLGLTTLLLCDALFLYFVNSLVLSIFFLIWVLLKLSVCLFPFAWNIFSLSVFVYL